jgi:hypothetical protein
VKERTSRTVQKTANPLCRGDYQKVKVKRNKSETHQIDWNGLVSTPSSSDSLPVIRYKEADKCGHVYGDIFACKSD